MSQTHQFVPLGFEAGGGFGPATLQFLQEIETVASQQSSADLYHWSAMMWGEHWRQRLSLELARGQASLVLEAVSTARGSSTGANWQGTRRCHGLWWWTASAVHQLAIPLRSIVLEVAKQSCTAKRYSLFIIVRKCRITFEIEL